MNRMLCWVFSAGLTLFSTTPKTVWHLNTHQTKQSLLTAIEDLEKAHGSTYTGEQAAYDPV